MGSRVLWWCALASALGLACAKGDEPSASSLSAASLGEGGETETETGNSETDDDDTGSGGDFTSTGDSTSTGVLTSTGSSTGGSSCSDMMVNGDETDIDCGGSCMPCEMGQLCGDPADCATGICEGGSCCTSSTYERSTGKVSGSDTVCCDGDDARLGLTECGTGMNYTVQEEGANCASTTEGAMNNGTACVTVTCELLLCTAGDTGTT